MAPNILITVSHPLSSTNSDISTSDVLDGNGRRSETIEAAVICSFGLISLIFHFGPRILRFFDQPHLNSTSLHVLQLIRLLHFVQCYAWFRSILFATLVTLAAYTFFQNGRHLNILLSFFKLALDASLLSLQFKGIFCLERSIKV